MELNEARQMAIEEMKRLGIPNWYFQFDNARRRFGYCSYRKCTIGLSKYLTALNGPDKVMETIRHEVAHALSYIEHSVAGRGHGQLWKEKCAQVGCSAARTYDSTVVTPKVPFAATCPTCGKVYKRSRPRPGVHCGICYGKRPGNMTYLAWRRV